MSSRHFLHTIYQEAKPLILPFITTLLLSACGGGASGEKDSTSPVITLQGDSTINLAYNQTYTDDGAVATDEYRKD